MSSISPDIVTDGLVVCLDAADKKSYSGSGDTWYDRSGNDNNGTLENDPTFSTDGGGCLDFDGVDDYVTTPYVIGAISMFSVSCWAKGTAAGNRVLVSDLASDGSNKSSRFQIAFDDKTIYVNMGDGTNYYYAIRANTYDATSTLFDGNWHHVALTINVETQKFYIDGALVHTHDTTDAATRSGGTSAVLGTAGADDMTIGRWGDYHGGYWSGKIANFNAYQNRELSAAEVLQNFNAMKSRFGVT
jgi:hypothetical protein